MTGRRKVRYIVVALAICVLAGASAGPGAWAAPAEAAVVVDLERVPDAQLPGLDDLQEDVGRIVERFRAAGLRVVTDPTGRCLAVTRRTQISDDDLLAGDAANSVLAAGILERTTSAQLAARQKGYVRAEALSEVQLAAARRIGKRIDIVDDQGRVTTSGAHLVVGIWPNWVLHLSMQRDGDVICRQLLAGGAISPPTPAVVPPPLAGSVLWYAWPYSAARWGNERTNVEAGTYTLGDLLAKLSQAGKVRVTAHEDVRHRRVAVVADGVPVRTLLWAIEVGTGLQVRVEPASVATSIVVAERSSEHTYRGRRNALLPMPDLGYYSPSDSASGRRILEGLPGGRAGPSNHWIGWRLSEMPLLFRKQIEEEWIETCGRFYEKAPPLDPETTFVLWTKAVMVSVNYQLEDGRGGGIAFPFPAL